MPNSSRVPHLNHGEGLEEKGQPRSRLCPLAAGMQQVSVDDAWFRAKPDLVLTTQDCSDQATA